MAAKLSKRQRRVLAAVAAGGAQGPREVEGRVNEGLPTREREYDANAPLRQLEAKGLVKAHGVHRGPKRWTATEVGRVEAGRE